MSYIKKSDRDLFNKFWKGTFTLVKLMPNYTVSIHGFETKEEAINAGKKDIDAIYCKVRKTTKRDFLTNKKTELYT